MKRRTNDAHGRGKVGYSMGNEVTATQDTGTQDGATQTIETDEGNTFAPITSQEQFDKMVRERVERAKRNAIPADYDELKAKAARLDASAAELEKLTKRAEKAEAEADAFRHDKQLADWRKQVAASTGVPADVLRGDTLEDIQAHAETIKAAMPVYPQVQEHSGGALPMSKADIFAIKNPKERKAAILANLSRF